MNSDVTFRGRPRCRPGQLPLPLRAASGAALSDLSRRHQLEDLETATRSRARRDILLSAILFVLGFTTVFVALGATASVFGGCCAPIRNPVLGLPAGLSF